MSAKPGPGHLPPSGAFLEQASGTAIFSGLKPVESEHEKALILRLCEEQGSSGEAVYHCGFPVKQVLWVDALERPLSDCDAGLRICGSKLRIPLEPYQIGAVKLVLGELGHAGKEIGKPAGLRSSAVDRPF